MPNRPTSLLIPGDRLLLAANFLTHARRLIAAPGWPVAKPVHWPGFATGTRLETLTQRSFPLKEALKIWGGWSSLVQALRDNAELQNADIDIVPALELEPDVVKDGFFPFLAAVAAGEVGAIHLTEIPFEPESDITQTA